MFEKRKKSLLLVDFDNVERVGPGLTRKISNWLSWIEDGAFDPTGVRRELLLKRVYWNSQHDRYRIPFERGGFEVAVCQAWRSAKGSSVDFELTIDAIDYANAIRRLDEVIILAFDTDYLSVVHRLQQKEIEAVLMVTDQAISNVYRDRANHVISEEQLRDACDYVRPAPGLFGMRASPRAVQLNPDGSTPTPSAQSPAPEGAPQIAHDAPFDLGDAIQRIERAGAQTPGKPLSKRVVCDLLREVRGFYMTPPRQFFGRESYYPMIEHLAQKSKQLQVMRLPGGGKAIVFRAPKPPKPDA